MDELLIFTTKFTSRFRYIAGFLLRDILGIKYRITTDASEFNAHTGPKFSYGPHALSNELFFQARNLLGETGINEQNISVSDWKELKIFFTTGKLSALPFDPFSASFYLVTRYEEYLPYLRDKYDRFETKESLAFQNGFIHQPVVDLYALEIKKAILLRFPDFTFPERKYKYVSTIDIDNAYAYREKGLLRILGGYLRSIINLDFAELLQRTRVFLGLEKDPYDTYDLQLELQNRYQIEQIYFFLLADYGVNDKNVPFQNQRLQNLIRLLADYAKVGIHPSFGSNEDKTKLKNETERLSQILNTEVKRSRQHFLKLNFPGTYRNLMEVDIQEDYTMGFAHEIGFRAGTCTPFLFYDLDLEIETKLRVFPFAVMDATLKYYMQVSPEHAMSQILPLINNVKNVQGTFMSLWHNESLSENETWRGWRKVYEEMLKAAHA
jgi:hypothetical protein